MKKTSFYLTLSLSLLLLCFTQNLKAQLFKGGLILGGNFSQIEGDGIGGYTKLGLVAGGTSELALNDRWHLSLDILYSQKGSASSSFFTGYDGTPFKIRLNYIDLPLMVKYHDKKGGLIFGAGLSLNRLLSYKYLEMLAGNMEDFTAIRFTEAKPFNSWDLSAVAGFGYKFSEVWGIDLRFNYSLLPYRKDCSTSVLPKCGWFNNVISMRTLFLFSAKGKKKNTEE